MPETTRTLLYHILMNQTKYDRVVGLQYPISNHFLDGTPDNTQPKKQTKLLKKIGETLNDMLLAN